MIAVLIILGILAVSQFFFVLALSALIRHREDDRLDHAKCVALIAQFVGDEFAIQVLLAAAEDYDSIEGQADLSRIRLNWTPGQSDIPAVWMRERAANIRADSLASRVRNAS